MGNVVPLRDLKEATIQPLEERDDDVLMVLARQGVDNAFDRLVQRHQAKVLRMARKILGQPGLASDVAQNTFLEMYRALPRYKACGKFQSYLYRILLNQCRMALRTKRYENRTRQTLAEPRIVDPISLPDAKILNDEQQRRLEGALAQLSRKLRDAVVLRYCADMSYQEIADVLNIPLGTVKRRLFDGLDRLRRVIAQERN